MTTGTAPGTSTFSLTPPRRPGDDDLNDHALVDDTEDPPGDSTLPSAELFNTESALAVDYGAVSPIAVISVIASGSPSFGGFTCIVKSIRELPAASTFSLTRLAGGDYTITWAAGALPNLITCTASLNDPLTTPSPYSIGAALITNGVGIATKIAGFLTDVNFTVVLW